MLETKEYHRVVSKMRDFFAKRGFVEVPVQSRLSILAACEDPTTIAQFRFGGEVWPLPQTGQMWLEHELLTRPELVGVFCISTSYRDEKNPIPGRHDKIFPMFEFESRGDLNDLVNLERELLKHLGFISPAKQLNYQQVAKFYDVETLEAEHETSMAIDFAHILFLTNFPFVSHPFWNMKHQGNDIFAKVDAILHGMETIGGAERSCNAEEMRKNFYSVSGGQYAQKLFELFSQERVEAELNRYLALPMTPRFGAGIGVTRMARAMKKEGILQEELVAIS